MLKTARLRYTYINNIANPNKLLYNYLKNLLKMRYNYF